MAARRPPGSKTPPATRTTTRSSRSTTGCCRRSAAITRSIACASQNIEWTAPAPSGTPEIVDSDIRLNGHLLHYLRGSCRPARADGDTCWGIGVEGRYDILSIVVHEVGHRAGFEHVDDINQVMNDDPTPGPLDGDGNPVLHKELRKLGKGDAEGNNHKY